MMKTTSVHRHPTIRVVMVKSTHQRMVAIHGHTPILANADAVAMKAHGDTTIGIAGMDVVAR